LILTFLNLDLNFMSLKYLLKIKIIFNLNLVLLLNT
jgi:hypothetical protein